MVLAYFGERGPAAPEKRDTHATEKEAAAARLPFGLSAPCGGTFMATHCSARSPQLDYASGAYVSGA
jgi:hypothetical protein